MNAIQDSPFAVRFTCPDPKLAYLDGNSLGRMPRAVPARIQRLLEEQWSDGLIRSWNLDWLRLPGRLAGLLSPLIGATADEIQFADSTSINLFKLAWAAMEAQPTRYRIVTDAHQFPSDLYILDGIAKGCRLPDRPAIECHRVAMNQSPTESDLVRLIESIDDRTGLVCLSHVLYQSGYLYDMERLTRAAHQRGAMILWDLSHSVGAVPIELVRHQVDLAVGCTYKYLNGGPGSPAFLYVRRDWQKILGNPIAGWFSSQRPFEFSQAYEPADTIQRWSVGTPAILSLAAIECGLEIAKEAGIDWIRHRSIELTERLIERVDGELTQLGYELITPRESQRRGSHIGLNHERGWQISQALIDRFGVLPDFRPPSTIRLGVSGLYTSVDDLDRSVEALRAAVVEGIYQAYPEARDRVP